MSSLTLHIGRSIGATLGPGDEIVVTTLDHEANVSTWRAMAADRGVTVQTVDIDPTDVTLDLEDLESKLSSRTKLVAVGYASNAVGTVNPVREIVARAHEVGALTYVDAVAFAPHGPIDVRALDTDFLACSAYKWFGPHLGALYGKAGDPRRACRPSRSGRRTTAGRPGRQSFESIAGHARRDRLPARRRARLRRRRRCARRRRRERAPARAGRRRWSPSPPTSATWSSRSSTGSKTICGVTIHGIVDPARFDARVPTVSVSIEGVTPRAAAEALARDGIYAWDGDFYATGLIERLGKAEAGGVLRLGLVHYNTAGRGRPDARGARSGSPPGS